MRSRYTRDTPPELQPTPDRWQKLVGQRFGRLTVLGFAGTMTPHGQKMATCRCDCGFYVDVMPASLRSGATSSCGCVHSETVERRNRQTIKHGAARMPTGARSLPYLYRTWTQIKARCLSEGHEAYADYGGRGIKVHEPWRTDYQRFEDDIHAEIGRRPGRTHSLDRANNNGNYEPGNLRWATSTQQSRNRRSTKLYDLNGESRPLAEWADIVDFRYDTLRSRVLVYGWPLDEALGTPSGSGRCPLEERVKWTSTEAYQSYLKREKLVVG